MTSIATISKDLQRTLPLSRNDEQVKSVQVGNARYMTVQILEEAEETESSGMLRVDRVTARSVDQAKNAIQIEEGPEVLLSSPATFVSVL